MMSLRLEEFSAIESLSVTMALPFSLFLLLVLYGSYVVARDYVRDNETATSESQQPSQQPAAQSTADD